MELTYFLTFIFFNHAPINKPGAHKPGSHPKGTAASGDCSPGAAGLQSALALGITKETQHQAAQEGAQGGGGRAVGTLLTLHWLLSRQATGRGE